MSFAAVLLLAAVLPGVAGDAVVFERKAADLFVLKVDGVPYETAIPEIARKMGARIERFGDAPFDLTLDVVVTSRDDIVEAIAREGGFVAVGSHPSYQLYALDLGDRAPETVATTYYRVEQGDLDTIVATLTRQFPAPSGETPGLTVQKLPPIASLALTGPIETLLEAVTFLHQIDEQPAMVFVELMVVEFFHNDAFDWSFSLTDGARRQVSDLAYSPGSGRLGFLYDFVDVLDPSFKLNLLALVDKGEARVMTNPRLAVLNGTAGNISLTQQLNIPLTNTTDAGTAISLEQVEAKVSLDITPTVLPSKVIELTIAGEVTVFTSTAGTPSTAANTVDTKVRVRNNETIILGGLIERQILDRVKGVPGLRKIPLLGALFRQKSEQVNYAETAIYITPRLETSAEPAAIERLEDELDAVAARAFDGMAASAQRELERSEELEEKRKQSRKERRRARRNRGQPPGGSR